MQRISTETIQAIVAQIPDLQLVYLFGSRGSGRPDPASDWDFALYMDDGANGPSVRSTFNLAIAKLLIEAGLASSPVPPHLIDVVLLNRAPIELAYSVISTGRLLYRRDESTQVEYEAYVLGCYGDYLPVLRFYREAAKLGYPDGKNIERYRTALERTERTLAQARATGQTRPD